VRRFWLITGSLLDNLGRFMIHFPGHWLKWLRDTSTLIGVLANPTPKATSTLSLSEMEFRIHTALFVVRKIEESIGVDLKLSDTKVSLCCWPVAEKKKAKILRTPNPDFEEWYQLNTTTQQKMVSYKRIIDLFIHARICNFMFEKEAKSFHEVISLFVASDHTMKEQIVRVPIGVLNAIFEHAVSIFEPIVAKRARRKPTGR
jgi:hypothetical protein